MPKLLPLTDVRARRTVLTRRDFGYAPKPASPPSDLIDKATWDSIVNTLPDDVAVRTTNYHGTTIRQLHDLWGAWIECVGEKQDCMSLVMLDAGDGISKRRPKQCGDWFLSALSRSLAKRTGIDHDWSVGPCLRQTEGIPELALRVSPRSPRPGLRRAMDRRQLCIRT